MTGRTSWQRWLAAALMILGIGTARASAFDPAAFKTISQLEVIRFATIGYFIPVAVGDAAHRGDALAAIAALDPKVQTLVWLALLENGLSVQTATNHDAPSAYIRMSSATDPQIAKALADSGLSERAAIFAAATAAQGATTMLELGPRFGTKAAFGEAIVAYARRTPTVAAWCDTARRNLSDEDRLRALTNMLWQTETPDWLHDWPAPYRDLLLVDQLDGEVGNGGVDQYFYNASGDNAPAAVAALRTLGLPRQAEAIARGIGYFPTPYPTDERSRRASLRNAADARDDKLDSLTGSLDDGTVRPAMIAFAKANDLLPR